MYKALALLRVINLVNTCGISASAHEKNCADRRSHRYKKESFCFTYLWAYFRRSYGMRGRRRKGNRTCALSLPPPLPGKSAEHDGWERERNLSPPPRFAPYSPLPFFFLALATRGRGDYPQFTSGNWCDINTSSSVSATLPLSQNHANFLGT